MKRLFKSSALAMILATAAMVQTAVAEVSINAVTLAPAKAYISNPFRMFVDEVNEKFAGEVKINSTKIESHFLFSLAAAAGVGRFAVVGAYFAAGRAPFA